MVDFGTGQEKTAHSEVIEIGTVIVSDRLAFRRLFAAALNPPQKTIRVQRFADQRMPTPFRGRRIVRGREHP